MLHKTWPLKTAKMSAIQDASGFAVICFVQKMQHLFMDISCDSLKLYEPISLKKKSDFQFWFEEIEKKLHPARMVASLPAGTEPNFSSDMTVQPPVRRDLLLSSYQWGRGMPHTQIKT